MNPRELIILTLGLAIIAVVLRGLYVALKARRGQIKLSIDKNIPQDIDLEAMELAELPGGGARVVERPVDSITAQNSKLDEARERASALNLGDLGLADANIPVLMDAVELGETTAIPTAESKRVLPVAVETGITPEAEVEAEAKDESFQNQDIEHAQPATLSPERDDQEWSGSEQRSPISESAIDDENDFEDEAYERETEFLSPAKAIDEDHGVAGDRRGEVEAESEHDDVLLDYDQNDYGQNNFAEKDNDQNVNISISESDALANVAPNYVEAPADIEPNEDEVEEDWESDEPNLERDFDDVASEQNVQVEEEVSDHSNCGEDDESDDSDLSDDSGDSDDRDNSSGQSFEEQLDDFSMTAGDRIGYDNNIIKAVTAARSAPAPETDDSEARLSEQSGFFDDEKSNSEENSQSDTGISKRSSFLSAFRRKPKEMSEQPEAVTGLASEKGSGNRRDEVNAVHDEIMDPVSASSANETAKVDSAEPLRSDDKAAVVNQPTEVLVVNVMAREGFSFAGDDLLQVLITAGLKFGEMNIFHHHIDSNTKGPVLYSVANVLNPGTFDLNNMSDFSTLGVSFFLALPTSINNLDAFETMLSVAQQIKGGLDGDLRDDARNLMTAQTIEHYRQRVRDFELRQLKAGIRS